MWCDLMRAVVVARRQCGSPAARGVARERRERRKLVDGSGSASEGGDLSLEVCVAHAKGRRFLATLLQRCARLLQREVPMQSALGQQLLLRTKPLWTRERGRRECVGPVVRAYAMRGRTTQ